MEGFENGEDALVQTLCHKRSNSFLDKIVFTPKTVWSNSFFGVVKIIWSGFYSGSNWFYSGSKLYNFYPPPVVKIMVVKIIWRG